MRGQCFREALPGAVALVLVTTLTAILFYSRFVLLHALIGVGIGVLASPLLNTWNRRLRVPRVLGGFLLFLLISAVGAGIFCIIYQLVADQANLLSEQFPDIFEKLRLRFVGVSRSYPWARGHLEKFSVVDTFQTGLRQVFLGVQNGIVTITNVALDVLIGIYTAIHAEEYFAGVVEAFPARARNVARSVLTECGVVLRKWFHAQLIDMAIIGLITASGLWLVGVDYWAVYGLLTAVLGIIPFIGMLFVVIAAFFITLAAQPELVWWVVLVFGITQQIEGNVVLPLVMKGQADLPEVPLLVFMLLMGTWFGIIGVFVAPGAFAVVRILYLRIYLPRLEGQQSTEGD